MDPILTEFDNRALADHKGDASSPALSRIGMTTEIVVCHHSGAVARLEPLSRSSRPLGFLTGVERRPVIDGNLFADEDHRRPGSQAHCSGCPSAVRAWRHCSASPENSSTHRGVTPLKKSGDSEVRSDGHRRGVVQRVGAEPGSTSRGPRGSSGSAGRPPAFHSKIVPEERLGR